MHSNRSLRCSVGLRSGRRAIVTEHPPGVASGNAARLSVPGALMLPYLKAGSCEHICTAYLAHVWY